MAIGQNRRGGDRKSIAYQMSKDPRFLAARGYNPLVAAEILAHVIDERGVWARILASQDDRVVLQAMMFLVSMRDGKPAQNINVTSKSVNISATSIQQAREIIAEIRNSLTDAPSLGHSEVSGSLMLAAGEGGQKEGG